MLPSSLRRTPFRWRAKWGSGDVASADGLRFVAPIRAIHSGPNSRYFGQERGVSWYNVASDQFTGLNAMTVPGTLCDSLNLFAIVLEQETELQSTEIMTNTAGYTDTIFGIFYRLGYQFSPRIVDIGGARFWRTDAKSNYSLLETSPRTGSTACRLAEAQRRPRSGPHADPSGQRASTPFFPRPAGTRPAHQDPISTAFYRR